MILTHTHPSEDKQSRPGALDTELVAVTYTVLLYATELQAKRYVRIFLKKLIVTKMKAKINTILFWGKKNDARIFHKQKYTPSIIGPFIFINF